MRGNTEWQKRRQYAWRIRRKEGKEELHIDPTTEPCNFRHRISLQITTSSVGAGRSEARDGTAVATWWNVGGSLARGETVGLLHCSLHYCPNVRPRAVSEVLTAMYTVQVPSVAILTRTILGLNCRRHLSSLFTTVNKFSPNQSHTTQKTGLNRQHVSAI